MSAADPKNAPVLTRTFSLDRGRELDVQGLERMRPHVALQALIAALSREPAFWRQVNAVVADARPRDRAALEAAGVFGSARRRRVVIGRPLFVAASAESRHQALHWLRLLSCYSYWVPPDTGQRGAYAMRDEFIKRVDEGARVIARRGGAKCIVCEAPLAGAARSVRAGRGDQRQGRRVRRDLCSAHERDPLQRWRNVCVDRLFKDASKARGLRSFELSLFAADWSDAIPVLSDLEESPLLGSAALRSVSS